MAKHIVFYTFGSLGDLYPYVAVGLELKRRGHKVTIATNSRHMAIVEAEGLIFRAVRPDSEELGPDSDVVKKAMHPLKGTEYIFREIVLRFLNETFADSLNAAHTADLLVSHAITFTVPIVAEKLGIPWISTVLSPAVFFSIYDPPVLSNAPFLKWLSTVSPGAVHSALGIVKWNMRSWAKPLHKLRRDLGLPAASSDPLFEGHYSKLMTLGLFSPQLAGPNPDWPPNTVLTGFPFYQPPHPETELAELETWLQAGPAPLVFTLGSAAVMDPGRFYQESVKAARSLGYRALLLTGKMPEGQRKSELSNDLARFDFLPHANAFARAAAIVHHGGVGTTGQALKAGHPQLFMPYTHDQPDNAARCVRLGVAGVISRRGYKSAAVAHAFRRLLQPEVVDKAAEIGAIIRTESGAMAAADAIETVL